MHQFIVLDGQHVERTRECVGCLLVLVPFGTHVIELAAQVSVLLAERGLAGGDGSLSFDPGVEAIFQVGVLVGADVPLDACFSGEGDDGAMNARAVAAAPSGPRLR